MSVPYTVLLPWFSLCQKLSNLVKVSQSYNNNNFDYFFETLRTITMLWHPATCQLPWFYREPIAPFSRT